MSSKKKTLSFEHTLRHWEIKYGYISVKSIENWQKIFSSMIGKNRDITVFGKKLFARKVDEWGRIYVGPTTMEGLKEGDIIVCSRDPEGNYSFERKK